MHKSSIHGELSRTTIILQIVVALVGIGVLALMLIEPNFEGRNVGASLFEIYFKDPFLAYVYISSIAFFVAIYQGIKILGYVRQNKAFSEDSVKALRTIRYCATTLVALILGAETLIVFFNRGQDDITGGIFMGLLLIFASGIVAIAAGMFEKLLSPEYRNSLDK